MENADTSRWRGVEFVEGSEEEQPLKPAKASFIHGCCICFCAAGTFPFRGILTLTPTTITVDL